MQLGTSQEVPLANSNKIPARPGVEVYINVRGRLVIKNLGLNGEEDEEAGIVLVHPEDAQHLSNILLRVADEALEQWADDPSQFDEPESESTPPQRQPVVAAPGPAPAPVPIPVRTPVTASTDGDGKPFEN